MAENKTKYVNYVFSLNFNLVSRWQERIEADNELRMSPEERGYAGNDTRRVNTVKLKQQII